MHLPPIGHRLLVLSLGLLLAPLATAGGGHEGEEPEADPGIRSIDLAPGASWSQTFPEVRQFDYHCHPHPWMLAGIQVVASTGRAPQNHTIEIIEPPGQDFEKWTFSPAVTTIEAGDVVTWVNKGSVMHVVQETTAEHVEHIGTAAAAGDDHDAAAMGADSGHGRGGFEFPVQGLLWVTVGLVGGILIGTRATRPKPPTGADKSPTPSSVEPSPGTSSAAATTSPNDQP